MTGDFALDKNASNLSSPAYWLWGFGEGTLPFSISIQRVDVQIVATSLSCGPADLRAFTEVSGLLSLWLEELVLSGSKCCMSIWGSSSI